MKEDKNTTETTATEQPTASGVDGSSKSPEELISQINESTDTLEVGPKVSSVDSMANDSVQDRPQAPQIAQEKGFKKILAKLNIYVVLFIFIIVLAGASSVVFYFINKREVDVRLATSELTEEDIEVLKTTDAIVGDPKQILTVESNAVITGKVVMRDSLDVAGALRIGGALSLPSIRSAGEGSFGSLQTNDFQAAGNAAVGGILDIVGTVTMGENLTVKGAINAGGRLDIGGPATINGNLNVNGTISATGLNFSNLSINRLNISGGQPSIAVGGAAGGGATASVAGTDTAGTATINTGGGTGTGILATITFTGAFSSSNPHPVLTPNGPGCANVDYYVTNITATQFAIATASNPSSGTTCRFNYIVIN